MPSGTTALGAPSGLDLIPATMIRDTIPAWVWEYDGRGRILKGGVTLFAGRPAAGKSTTARWFAAGWTRGTIGGCWEGKPVNVLYVASEESWQHTVKPSLKAVGADMERVKIVARDGEPARIKSVADELQVLELCRQHDVRAIILDPLMSTLDGRNDIYKSNEVREALDPWVRICEAIDGTVLGITHLTKAPKGDITAGINGSSAFGEVARCVFGFAIDREADDGTRVMTQSKNSSGVEGLNLAYRLTETPVTVSDGRTTEMVRFEPIGPTSRTVRDILIEERGDAGGQRKTAGTWLKAHLAVHGTAWSADVYDSAAVEAGFSRSAIQKAAQTLSVQQRRTKTSPPRTYWGLPSVDMSEPPEDQGIDA